MGDEGKGTVIVVIRRVRREEIMSAIKKWKARKAAGMDGIVEEMLKFGDVIIIDWLVNIFNRRMELGAVPENWKECCRVVIVCLRV